MTYSQPRAVTRWLYLVCLLVGLMVVLGGYVRLTRSGLSIVEWNPVSGVIPPTSEEAWQLEFSKYQQTPEFQKVNAGMTLDDYKRIFYLEYFHRLLARFAGLLVVIPLAYFLFKGIIPWRQSGIYLLIAALFAFQGALGWYMVSSGLVDQPRVDEFRLTAHLLTALALLAIALWKALSASWAGEQRAAPARVRRLALALMVVVLVQITYGGLMAGLRAGYISNTWPLMFGQLIPAGLFGAGETWFSDLIFSPTTVHFIHRWLAFAVLAVAAVLLYQTRGLNIAASLRRALLAVVALVLVQIALGVGVVLWRVPISLALLHQATAMLLFASILYVNYLCRRPLPERSARRGAVLAAGR